MSKKFKYNSGYEGVVSDKVAEVLVTKKQGKVVGDEKPADPKKDDPKK